MYDQAKSCVRVGNTCSEFFDSNVGVRQGENLSPVLFALFLNDLVDFLHNKYDGLSDLGSEINKYLSDDEIDVYLRLYVLLYADDTVLLAESADDLQKALHLLEDYCNANNLVVNSSKTKVMIFSRGCIRNLPRFTFNDKKLDVVKSYKYLGIIFNYNGSFKIAQKELADNAVRAMFSVLAKGRKLGLPIDIMLKLFDHTVKPILLYGSEVWGSQCIDLIERVQVRFIKLCLKLQKRTPTVMVRGETGCYPLKVDITSRVLCFWFKMINGRNKYKLSHMLYKCMFGMYMDGYFKCGWLQFVKDKLDSLGLSYMFLTQATEMSLEFFKATVKQKCKDQFIQNWNADLQENPLCTNYRIFKKTFVLEKYLVDLPFHLAIDFLKFRCRSALSIVNEIDHQYFGEKCFFCDFECMDEFHLTMNCVYFKNDRLKIKDRRFFENSNCLKFESFMSESKFCFDVAKLCQKISKALKAFTEN